MVLLNVAFFHNMIVNFGAVTEELQSLELILLYLDQLILVCWNASLMMLGSTNVSKHYPL